MADCIKLFEYFIDDFVIKQKLCLFGTSDDSANVDLSNLIKIVKKAFVDNFNDSKDASFDEKLSAQFSNIQDDNVKKCFDHFHWLWAFAATDCKRKNQGKLTQIDVVGKFRMDKEDSGIGGANPRLQKYDEIKYLILLMEKLVGLKLGQVDDVKSKIIELIIGNEIDSANLPIKNALLHLCDPIHFEPIFSHSHKNKIKKAFPLVVNGTSMSLADAWSAEDDTIHSIFGNKNDLPVLETDYVIFKIKSELNRISNNGFNSFYDDDYVSLWNVGSSSDFDEFSSLKFKKAIILYGPPGTSKSFSARKLAENFIIREGQKSRIYNVASLQKSFNDQIHWLQLHANYSYDDFVWGYQLKEKNGATESVAKKGYLLNLIDSIKNDKKIHFLILDEINRVDLSRLFGELFSAIENRGTPVELSCPQSLGTTSVAIPENLYFIGTMNEIDFSLERVDFALRRRFVWWFYGFDSDRLNSIIKNKPSLANRIDLDEYIQTCDALNKEIDKCEILGPQYQIGHTFFAEIVDVMASNPYMRFESAKQFLWDISIKPMLSAFLGNCTAEERKDYLGDNDGGKFGKIFLGKKK